MTLILGSASPRRCEILQFFSLPFRIVASNFDEESIPFLGDPQAFAMQLSDAKGRVLAEQLPSETILTADTVVFCDGIAYGKPRDYLQAKQFLTSLAGKWHSVFTALTLYHQGSLSSHLAEETKVLFNNLTEKQQTAYLAAVPWQDKAAGYAIQGSGGMLVKKIDGCYYNVMGMPINSLAKILTAANIDLWGCL